MTSSATPTRTFRIPDSLWVAAKDRAAIEGKTLTEIVIAALKEFTYGDTSED